MPKKLHDYLKHSDHCREAWSKSVLQKCELTKWLLAEAQKDCPKCFYDQENKAS